MSINAVLGVGQKVYKVGKAVLKATPEMVFGTSADKVGKVLRESYASGASAKETAKAGYNAILKAGEGNFFKKTWKNLKTLIPDVTRYTKAGSRLAKMKGTNQFTGALKGLAKGLGKKLPFVFAAMMLVGEIPNIITATKEKGLVQGIKETAKPVVRLAGAGLGAAIGSAVAPGVGSLVGWVAGEWLAGRVVGKSYTEEKADKEKVLAEYVQKQGIAPIPQTNQYQPNLNPYAFTANTPFTGAQMSNPFITNPYDDDILMQQLNLNKLA